MDKRIQQFLQIMKSSIYDEPIDREQLGELDWDNMFHDAQRNITIPLFYKKIAEIAEYHSEYVITFEKWKKHTMFYMVREMEKRRALKELQEKALKNGILFVVFKGIVLANLYPNVYSRTVSDSDLFVFERDKVKAISLLEELGYKKDEESSKDEVPVYELKEKFHVVELHFSLWEDHKGSKIDLLNSMNLVDETNLQSITIGGVNYTTLGLVEHLVYQMFHIIKHFSLQGIGMRYLADITLYVNKNSDLLNFEEFWIKMDQLGYTKFCEYFFSICVKYMNMNSNILKDRNIQVGPNVEGFLEDLFQVGILYEDKYAAWQILGIMSPYFTGVSNVPKSKFGRKLKILLPSSKMLPKQYSYAKKYPILLPIAWVHKVLHYLFKWSKNKENWLDAGEKMNVAENRLYLLRSLGLTEDQVK